MLDDEPTMHRVYVEWTGGYFITSLHPDFNDALQAMVEDMGQPSKVEFRATDEGWFDDNFIEDAYGDNNG